MYYCYTVTFYKEGLKQNATVLCTMPPSCYLLIAFDRQHLESGLLHL